MMNDGYPFHLPMIGLGTASLDQRTAPGVITEAILCGYRHIDCAARYKNQDSIGKALHALLAQGSVKRNELCISSKLWCSNQAKEDVLPAFRKSLTDLRLDYIDLYMLHWPVRSCKSALGIAEEANVIPYSKSNMEETWREMEKLVTLGLCKRLGVCNFNITMLEELLQIAEIGPTVNQVELHPYLPQNKLVKFCQENGILVTAFTPLGNAGRRPMYRNDTQPELLQDFELCRIAKTLAISPAQVALSWNINRGVSVIPKTVQVRRMKENFASQTIQLDSDDIAAINRISIRCRYIDFPWCYGKEVPFWEPDD